MNGTAPFPAGGEAIVCAFCGRGRSQVAWLFCNRAEGRLGRGSAICDTCIDGFAAALALRRNDLGEEHRG